MLLSSRPPLWLLTALYVLASFGAAPIRWGDLVDKLPDALTDGGQSAFFLSIFIGLFLAPLFAPLTLLLPAPPVAIRALISFLWLPSFPILIMSGPGTTHIFLYIFVTWAALMGLWAHSSRMGQALLLAVTLISLWSLGTVVLAVPQISALTKDTPYCVARSGTPIQSIADLRGLAFYTDDTGFKSTSRWTFHGVLLTETEAWNWSARHLRFDPIPEPVFPTIRRPDCPLEPKFLREHIF